MLRLLAAACLVLPLLATQALAQRAGDYAVQGQARATGAYSGSVNVTRVNDTIWRFTWTIGGDTTEGIGILGAGNLISVGYASDDKPGVVIYSIEPDGKMTGMWVFGDGTDQGMEILTPR